MGGGAGITWELELESLPLDFKRGKFIPARKPVITTWHASDYMNAMQNIRPDLLRLISIKIDDPNGAENPDMSYDWAAWMNGNRLEASSFSGYTRGPWQDTFPLTFSGQMHVDYYGDLNITALVTYRRKREFESFYNRLFEGYQYKPSDATIERKYGNLESYYADYWERLTDRYGA